MGVGSARGAALDLTSQPCCLGDLYVQFLDVRFLSKVITTQNVAIVDDISIR